MDAVELNQLRINRAVKLKETDWTQSSDSPLSDDKKAEFAAYRQELRDLPSSAENGGVVVFPEMPQ